MQASSDFRVVVSRKIKKKPAKRNHSVHELALGFAFKIEEKLPHYLDIHEKLAYWSGAYEGYSAGLRAGRKGK